MPDMLRPTVVDDIYARGLGVDLSDSDRITKLKQERDAAFEAIDRLGGYLENSLAATAKWKHRWVVVFGLLMGLMVFDWAAIMVLWLRKG